VIPADRGDTARALRSVEDAVAFGAGDFAEVYVLAAAPTGDARTVLAEAAVSARATGLDWLLAISAAESLVPNALVKLAPALRLHDAVWGGAGLVATGDGGLHPSVSPQGGGGRVPVEQVTRLAAQDLPSFFHAALCWWIGPTHFVRPAAALHALSTADGPAWCADYMMALWKRGRAYKTAQALTLFHTALPQLGEPDRARLVEALEHEPVFMNIRYGPYSVRAPYTGLNPVIEREQMRGLFFEQEELGYLAGRLPRGLRVLDVGANTGNHTLFFASVMEAETVIPVEPYPRAVAAIRSAVAENRFRNIDLARLGIAVGASEGRLTARPGTSAGLGAVSFKEDACGSVPLVPLDALVDVPVDLIKIDVEGMEMATLAGAAGLIAKHRPALFIEVLDETVAEFTAWADSNLYRIERLFPDKTHCNYVLLPTEGWERRD
jgi:FkbM family methyltransferase